MKLIKLKYFEQSKDFTCGPACLAMIFDFFGKKLKESYIAKLAKTTSKYGTKNINMINAVRKEGFYCYVHENGTVNQVKHFIDLGLPVIINYIEPTDNEGHLSVVIGYDKNGIIMNDPWNGRGFRLSYKELEKRWFDTFEGHKYKNWFMVVSNKKFNLGKQYLPLRH